jgi:arabinogalactan oligomer / maltooligosaccharide transport system substrate-binding protein
MKRIATLFALSLGLALSSASAAKLTVWTHFGGNEREWLVAAAQAFEKTAAAAGNTFEVVDVDFGAIKQKMILNAPKGEGGDVVVTLPQDQLGELVNAGVVEPLDKYFPVSERKDIGKGALSAFTYKGKLFGVPMFGEAVAIVYNKKLLPMGVPRTWEAFIKTAQNLTNPEKQQYGFLADIQNQYHMHGLYYAFGGYIFGDNKGTLDPSDVGLANAGANKAGQLINDLRYKYKLIPEGAESGDLQKSAFLEGKLAMWQTGPWSMGDIKDAKVKIDYGIDVLPRPTGATKNWSPFSGVHAALVNSYGKNKAVSAAFAKYLSSPANQVSFNKAGGRVPVSASAVKELSSNPVVAGFGKALAQSIPMPNIAEMGKVWGPWGNAVTLIAKTPGADVKALNEAAVKEIKTSIGK